MQAFLSRRVFLIKGGVKEANGWVHFPPFFRCRDAAVLVTPSVLINIEPLASDTLFLCRRKSSAVISIMLSFLFVCGIRRGAGTGLILVGCVTHAARENIQAVSLSVVCYRWSEFKRTYTIIWTYYCNMAWNDGFTYFNHMILLWLAVALSHGGEMLNVYYHEHR